MKILKKQYNHLKMYFTKTADYCSNCIASILGGVNHQTGLFVSDPGY